MAGRQEQWRESLARAAAAAEAAGGEADDIDVEELMVRLMMAKRNGRTQIPLRAAFPCCRAHDALHFECGSDQGQLDSALTQDSTQFVFVSFETRLPVAQASCCLSADHAGAAAIA